LPIPFTLIVPPEPDEPDEPGEPGEPDAEMPAEGELAGLDEPDVLGGALEEAGGELDDAVGVVIPPWHAVSDTPARQAATSTAAVRYMFIARWSLSWVFARSPAKLDSRLAGRIALLSQVCDTWRGLGATGHSPSILPADG
jgi:hypothetical protein